MSGTSCVFSPCQETIRVLKRPHETGDGPGVKDAVDFTNIICGLVHECSFLSEGVRGSAKQGSQAMDPVGQLLSLPAFFRNAGEFYENVSAYFNSDTGEKKKEIFTSSLATVNSGSEALMGLNSINVVSLKEALKTLSGVFWATAGALSGNDLFNQVHTVRDLGKEIEGAGDAEKGMLQHKRNIALIKIVKDISTIALGTLIIVSLLFASIAHWIIFSPIVTLSLSTIYFTMLFSSYYYDRYVASKETGLKA